MEGKFLVIAEQGAVIKEVTAPALAEQLDVMQKSVGGWIELFLRVKSQHRPGVTLDFYCNEEGRINGLPLNVIVDAGDGVHVFDIHGPVLITAGSYRTGDTLGLTDEEVKGILVDEALIARPWPVQVKRVMYRG